MPMNVDGMQQILARLERMGKSVEGKEKELLLPAGEVFLNEVKRRARELDDGIETSNNRKYGLLFENIWLQWDENLKTTLITTGNAFWAPRVELGSDRKVAKPFMEPAFNAAKDEAKDVLIEEIKRKFGL